MHTPDDSLYPLGELASKVLVPDRLPPDTAPPFACRPFVARTAERQSAYGYFTGQIGLAQIDEFTLAMRDLVHANTARILLDFSTLELSNSAVGALVAFAAAVHGHNRRLYIYRPGSQITSILKELSLLRFFSYLHNEEDILATVVI